MKTQEITIRRFTDGDGPAVRALIEGIMGREFQEAQGAYPTDDLNDIGANYGGLGNAFFVAECSEGIIGTVAIKKEDERRGLLRRLFVAAPFRNLRLGQRLVERALEFGREAGYSEVFFKTTSQMESAISLCEKCGFSQRAKLDLGSVELFKYAISLRNNGNSESK